MSGRRGPLRSVMVVAQPKTDLSANGLIALGIRQKSRDDFKRLAVATKAEDPLSEREKRFPVVRDLREEDPSDLRAAGSRSGARSLPHRAREISGKRTGAPAMRTPRAAKARLERFQAVLGSIRPEQRSASPQRMSRTRLPVATADRIESGLGRSSWAACRTSSSGLDCSRFGPRLQSAPHARSTAPRSCSPAARMSMRAQASSRSATASRLSAGIA